MTADHSIGYLVIRGGAAGCIVARRLAERLPKMTIALLEAGKSTEEDPPVSDTQSNV